MKNVIRGQGRIGNQLKYLRNWYLSQSDNVFSWPKANQGKTEFPKQIDINQIKSINLK